MARSESASNGRDGREGGERSSSKKSKTVHAADRADGRDGEEKPGKKSKTSHSSKESSAQGTPPNVGNSAHSSDPVNFQNSASQKLSNAGTTEPAKALPTQLDTLAKAKRLLQQQKELAEKLKKLPIKKDSSNAAPAVSAPSAVSAPVQVVNQQVTPTPAQPAVAIPGAMPAYGAYGYVPGLVPGMIPGIPGLLPNLGTTNYEAVKRAQELASRWGFQQGPMPILQMVTPPTAEELAAAAHAKSVKAPVLRLDAHGREVDENGNVVDRPKITSISTLKVNINKQKKEAFKILRPELEEDPVDNPFFDARVGLDKKKLVRTKRSAFQFVEEGKWSKQAEMLRLKSQFGDAKAKEIKTKQAALAKAKAEADINPNLIEVVERVPVKEEKVKDPIPDVEWWDAGLLQSGSYDDIADGKFRVKAEKITIYVEHPVPIEPPAEPTPPAPQPLKLTKKEQKKLRTQRRLAKEKDRQEMIRQGLLEPPKPKVKMSNLMKVLGAEATQDPTRLEQEIRSAAAEREQAHSDRNLARKLTPAERREKKEKKMFDDPFVLETIVSVYRINDLSHPQTRFKVDMNAQENRLTGCVVISDPMTIVVVEGGSKAIKRYAKLMLRRIKWATAVKDDENEPEGEKVENKCVLVWQGSVANPSFDKFLIQQCRTEAAARKYLADAGVGHYWDLAANFSED
ncbi:unnamed protein product [Calypogeia fissa]